MVLKSKLVLKMFINKFTSVHIKYQDLNFKKMILCTKVPTSDHYFVNPDHDKLISGLKTSAQVLKLNTFFFLSFRKLISVSKYIF